jgi:hypothetical protein
MLVVILFETTVLFDLHISGDNPCISVYIYRCYRICCFCIIFVLNIFGEIGGSKAILVPVSLNNSVIRFVSCPKYVNMIHLFCLWVFSFVCYWFVVVFFLFKFCSVGVYILY